MKYPTSLTQENIRSYWKGESRNMTDVERAAQRAANQNNQVEYILEGKTVWEVRPEPERVVAYNRPLGEKAFDPDAMEMAWMLIANAWEGNWDAAPEEWRTAATKWRDEQYFPWLRSHVSPLEDQG